jgi:hypothetical protein
MHLPPQQTNRFYHIWFALFRYINEERQLIPPLPATPERALISPADAFKLRNALWADEALRESFIESNPAGLTPADLALVESWRYRIAGKFYIMRHLKKYSVFLSEHPNHAYGVLGLVSPIEEVIGPVLPRYVEAVLLPFEGQIIYDSLLSPYSITFGSNIRRTLNDTYRNVQEREGIITSLEPTSTFGNPDKERSEMLARNAKIVNAFRKDLAKRGLSSSTIEQHASNIENFARTCLLAQDPFCGLLDMTLMDVQSYLETAGNVTNTVSLKRFVRFLIETDRMDYERAAPMRDFLQHAGI